MSLLAINLDDGQTDAAMSLMPFGSLFSGSGVLTAASLAVAAQISPDMTVKVSGSANNDKLIIITSTGATYFIKNTAVEHVTILANASGVTKTDAIVVYVDLNDGDPNTAGSPGAVHVIAVRRAGVSTGAPTNGEIDAATFNNPWFKLAQVVVTNGASSITSGNITDVRLACWLQPQFFGMDHLPGAALEDGTVTNTKLDPSAIHLGSTFKTTTQGSITSEVDLTGLAVTVTVPPGGRSIEITATISMSSTVAGRAVLHVKEGSTYLASHQGWVGNNTNPFTLTITKIITAPSAGAHTYKLAAEMGAGVGTMYAANDGFKASISVKLI